MLSISLQIDVICPAIALGDVLKNKLFFIVILRIGETGLAMS